MEMPVIVKVIQGSKPCKDATSLSICIGTDHVDAWETADTDGAAKITHNRGTV